MRWRGRCAYRRPPPSRASTAPRSGCGPTSRWRRCSDVSKEDFRRELNNTFDQMSGSPSPGLRDRVRSAIAQAPEARSPFWIATIAAAVIAVLIIGVLFVANPARRPTSNAGPGVPTASPSASPGGTPTPSPSPTPDAQLPAFTCAAGDYVVKETTPPVPTPAVAYITALRTGTHGTYDRITIEFSNGTPGHAQTSTNRDTTFTASPVAHRDVPDPHLQASGADQQVEVAERVELSEKGTIRDQGLVVLLEQRLGAAQSVLDGLTQEPAESDAEKPVAHQVGETHRLVLHGIDQPAAVGEVNQPIREREEELRQILGRHREVGVEDHQHLAACGRKRFPHGVAFAELEHEVRLVAVRCGRRIWHLVHQLDVVVFAPALDHLLDLLHGPIGRCPVDEDDLGPAAHLRDSPHGVGDVAGFVAARHNNGDAELPPPRQLVGIRRLVGRDVVLD